MGLREERGVPHWIGVSCASLACALVLCLPFPASAPAKGDLDHQLSKVQGALASNRTKKALKRLEPLRKSPLADHAGLLRGVPWIVMQEPIQLDAEQIAQFKREFTGNNRPTQPLNGRPVVTDSPVVR